MSSTKNRGAEMLRFAEKLYPIQRSLAGPGNRETLSVLSEVVPKLNIFEISSGTKFGDWTVPPEWVIRGARLVDPDGHIIADYSDHNLHVVGYSTPVDEEMSLDDLQAHLHSFPEQPEAIPYVSSYYQREWGFCLTENVRSKLVPGKYHALIDSEFVDGSMSMAELVIEGESSNEILISTYFCHPQMVNNELSGPVVAAHLANWVANLPERHFTYRFVFVPETIGTIAYISRNLEHLKKNLVAGYVLTCIGDDREYSYVESRTGNTLADRVANRVLSEIDPSYQKHTFMSRGSDERQYGSPGVDLPVGTLGRSGVSGYTEYHTSLDDFSVVTESGLHGGFEAVQKCILQLESNEIYTSQSIGEPFLTAYDLYPTMSKRGNIDVNTRTLIDVFAYSDGTRLLADIADQLDTPIDLVNSAANLLSDAGLLRRL
jgi:aminopeptidase-like protein